jgi:hypothetical protein
MDMIPKCVDDCPYRNLLKEAEQKLQQEKNNELHKCREQNKVKERKVRELNKKVLTLTVIATIAGTLIGKEALEFIGEWLGMLEGFKIGNGNKTAGVFPAPGTLAVFALFPLLSNGRRRK